MGVGVGWEYKIINEKTRWAELCQAQDKLSIVLLRHAVPSSAEAKVRLMLFQIIR